MQYKENFLPRLNLLTFDVSCCALDSKNVPSEVIFQKAGTQDYFVVQDNPKTLYNERTYHFDVPPKLQQHLQQYVSYVNNFNSLKNSGVSFFSPEPTFEIP